MFRSKKTAATAVARTLSQETVGQCTVAKGISPDKNRDQHGAAGRRAQCLVALAVLALISGTLLQSRAVRAGREVARTADPSPGLRSKTTVLSTFAATALPAIPQTVAPPSPPVNLTFDNLAAGTDVRFLFNDVKFSSGNGISRILTINFGGRAASSPNVIGVESGLFLVPIGISFPTAVNNLSFDVAGLDGDCDGFTVDVYQNNQNVPSTFRYDICTPFYPPFIHLDFAQRGFTNIKQVVIRNLVTDDPVGLDNFSFIVGPPPTPTPTPTPVASPTPPPPTNVKVTPDEEELTLTWTAAPGAGWYLIERSQSQPSFELPPLESADSAQISSPFFCDNISKPCKITEGQLDSNTTFTYSVFSVSNSGRNSVPGQGIGKPLPRSACSEPTIAVPGPGSAGTQVFWSMNYEVSDNDGLMIRNISLAGRNMAERFSVPYFLLKVWTDGQNPILSRGELRPNGSNPDGTLRSRLIKFEKYDVIGSLLKTFKATYAIDHIPGAPKACLTITQNYQFFPLGFQSPGDWPGPCEPSEELEDCTKFRPMVQYSFKAGDKEHLDFLTIPQRLHFQLNEVKAKTGNRVGIFRDRDSRFDALLNNGTGFEDERNPLRKELGFQAIVDGKKVNPPPGYEQWPPYSELSFDNFHQTWKTSVQEPSIRQSGGQWRFPAAGCPECVHMHWRWGSFFEYRPFGAGYPLLPPAPAAGNNQKLDIQIVKWRSGEEDPPDYTELIKPAREWLVDPRSAPSTADKVVMWYVSTGFRPDDKFFWHTAWFIPRNPDKSNATSSIVQSFFTAGAATAAQDGPISINLGDVYKDGPNRVENYDLSTLPPLPAGYSALNNTAYKITTEAVASGPYTIGFSAASIPDQATFNNLRIFHPEPDPFDPDRPMWVDATIASPDSPAPDYSSKTISGRTEELGVYVIAMSQSPPAPSEVADLSITSRDSIDPIVSGNTLTYTLTVTNSGPQIAHEVLVRDDLAAEVLYVSATPNQGSCKEIEGAVYCNLGSMNAGASVSIAVVVKTKEGDYPAVGSAISNTASVRAKEADNDQNNNSIDEITGILPNPNVPPVVVITAPSADGILVGPANIQIIANAIDSDGSISTVNFFDNEQFIGSGIFAGGSSYTISKNNLSFGRHTFLAAATDNQGRQTLSNAVNLIVNGPATVSIVSPSSQAIVGSGSNIVISASASHPSGTITKVEFFANTALVGVGVPAGGNRFDFAWNNIVSAKYSLVAVATDDLGVKTTSAPIVFTVGTPPTVSITSPSEGTVFPSSTNISISVDAQATTGSVEKVDFYSNGTLVGTATDSGSHRFTVTWRQLPDGPHSLTAVATDTLGLSSTSTAVNIGVNTPPGRPNEFVWFDDTLPANARTHADGDVDWYWVDANPVALSGARSHQSRNFAQLDAPDTSIHQHYFYDATQKLPVNAGDKLFNYVFLDINNMPREIMLQWNDGNGWEHRAYWGQNRIDWGTDGTSSRRYMGPIPAAGKWVRLEVPASFVRLEGTALSGMAFTLDGGRATWDLAGKATSLAPPQPSSSDFVWVDDAVPAGSILEKVGDNAQIVISQWEWLPPHFSGQQGHRSFFTANTGPGQFRAHSFRGAATPMMVQPGDVLFTYVYLDANNLPDELVLQWHDGSSWEHRAYWGRNYWGQSLFDAGITGTESRRYMGGLPPGNQWYRLEVPASYVGLEGKSVSGMSFGFYSARDHAGINWDYSGKSARIQAIPRPLSATTPVWRFFSSNSGYSYSLVEGTQNLRDGKFQVHANQAAGTVPVTRYRNANNEYFYTRFPNPNPNLWTDDGIAFYAYPDGSTPGTVGLYLFHDNNTRYFLTTNKGEAAAAGMVADYKDANGNHLPWAYVFPAVDRVPEAPTSLTLSGNGCQMNWRDNSLIETGFMIEQSAPNTELWNLVAIAAADSTVYCVGGDCSLSALCISLPGSRARVRAFNSFGFSPPSNVAQYGPQESAAAPDQPSLIIDPPTSPPSVNITSPENGDVVGRNFAIFANAFDSDGNGTIVKIEFFADGNKVGEIADAPYIFVWNNVALGLHYLTARAIDNAGAVTTSSAVNIMVGGAPAVSITGPANGASFNAPATVTISASASHPDGAISKVEFFQGSTKLGEDSTAPYGFDWTNVSAGNYSLTATATDTLGNATSTDPVNITVNGSNVPPTISITAPANGTVYTAPATLAINASAADNDGSISKVEFFNGSTKLGEDATAPYSFAWSNVGAGSYSLTAKATDNLGATATSSVVSITVGNSNAPPTVSLTAPANGAVFTAPASFSINASASDPDGSISKVEFFQGGSKIGEVTTAPYSFSWTNVPAGNYVLSARATDNSGVGATSASISVTVNGPTAGNPTNVSWTNVSSTIQTTGNSLAKISGANNWDAGAVSIQTISGDGYVEFTAGNTSVWRMCGLGNGDSSTSYVDIDYAFYLEGGGNLYVYESGNYRGQFGAYTGTDHLKVAVEGGAVKYYRNGSLLYTSTVPPQFPLLVDTSLNTVNTSVLALTDVVISGAGSAAPGLVGYWKFDDGSGSIAIDSSGNGNNGALTSGAGWSAGKSNTAVSLDGVDDYVQVGPRSGLVMSSAATFSAWIYPTGNSDGIIINKEGEYEIARFTDGSIQWAFSNSNPGWAWINTNYVAALNQWTHVALTYENGLVKTYINGTLTHSYGGAGTIAATNNDFRIGGRQCCLQHFPGLIDEVRVYNRVLTDTEVATLPGGSGSGNQPPVAVAGGPYSGMAGQSIQFNGGPTFPAGGGSYDPDGTITSYAWTFGDGGTGSGATPSHSYSTVGTYTATLTVTDNGGAQASANAAVTVNPNNVPPTISVTAPASGAVFTAPANVSINAAASDSDGSISKVEFFQGSTKLGEDATAPYSFAWANVPAGSYQLSARATDNNGLSASSALVSVTVNSPPAVSITSPVNGAVLQAPVSLTIRASATDSDGTVSRVDFYNNGTTLLGTATVSPFVIAWNNVAAGNYTLTARATDNRGASTTSGPVNVILTAPNQPPVANAGGTYSGTVGTAVQFNGSGSDPDGSISAYLWNFGDGSSGTSATTSHAYSTPGTYTATLTVTDNSGAQSSANATVIITNPTPGGPVTYYQASTDFSAIQGQRNWYYLDSSGAQMTFLNQWGGVWQTPNTSVYLGPGWGHPGDPADAMRQWRAPGAGSIRITGSAFDSDPGGGDGVLVSIRKGTQVLWERTIENGDATGLSYDVTTSVAAGDQINFVINRRSNTYWDSTVFDPTIAYTASVPPTAGLVAYWRLDENSGPSTADSSTSGINGTLQNGPTWTTGQSGAALKFDGVNDMVSSVGLANVTNNFTVSFWALPSATHEIDGESTAGYGGTSGQRYAIWPAWYDGGHCGVGVSVGTNGVSVYEHAANYMPATLVHSATLSGWTHITIVYENRQPRLYLNGILVKTGVLSPMSFVHLNPNSIGGQAYGYYAGKLDEVRVYNRALSVTEVATLPNPSYAAGAVADFSSMQNPLGSWSYGYKPTGGQFTLYAGTSTGFGAGANTWALPGQTCCPMVTRNNTGATYTYPAAPTVVQPADVLNLHPGPNNERSIVRWTAPAAGTYSMQGRFQGIDTGGTTSDVLVTHNGTTVFSGSVNGYTSSTPFSINRTVGIGDTIEFSVGYGSNGTYNNDSTGLSVTIISDGRTNVALSENGAVASASSTYNANYPASGANNGDRKLGYGSGGAWHGSTNTFPQWLQIDFNGSKTIDEVDVLTLQDGFASPAEPTEAMTFSLYGLTGFEVQYWNGSAWINVPGGSVSGNNKVWRRINFTPVTTSKIRVLTNGSVDGWTRVMEVEAWGTPAVSSSDGNTNGYTYRRTITIDHNKVPNTDQADFPLLFGGTYSYLATAANGGNVQNANGYDVVFTSDSGCTNKLNHEVEAYNASSGAVNYWIKVPLLSHTSDTVLYMCYGKSTITTDQSNKTTVWDSSYKGVWHLPNGAALTTTDSTANANHGSISSASPTAGVINGAASYNGAGQSTVISNAQSFDFEHNQPFSVEFWLKKPLDTVTNQILISKKNTYWTGAGFDFWTWAGSNNAIFDLMDSAGTWYEIGSNVNVQDNLWHHIVGTYDGSSNRSGMKMYVDGILTSTGPPAVIANTIRNPYNLTFGTNSVSQSDYLNGSLDEVRFSSSCRSADWIKTEYNNQISPSTFYMVSAGSTATARLQPVGASASNTYGPGNEASRAIDNNPGTFWNAGNFPQQWIQLDLGQISRLSQVRLLVGQLPAGQTTHQVYGGATPDSLSLLGTFDGTTQSGQWLEMNTDLTGIRYLKIITTSSPSWVAWSEIEVYGTPAP